MNVRLVEVERKSRILTKAQFGCLRDTYSLNVTRGCEFGCVYCYARGYSGAPPSGEVHLCVNLPDKLVRELDSPRRRVRVGQLAFNTASDSFQTHPAILDITYRCMKILLERGIGISFLTKGRIPDRFMALFTVFPDLVDARIGLISTLPQIRDIFEPHTASPEERLQNIARLQKVGVKVSVRVDPIIPFFTDDDQTIEKLYTALKRLNIKQITLSYLHVRPSILQQLQKELPATELALIKSCFEGKPWIKVGESSRSKLVPTPLRQKGYRRFNDKASKYGITNLICACKNPDIPGDLCMPEMRAKEKENPQGKKMEQLALFPC